MRAGGKATPHQTGDAEGLPVNSHPEDKRLQTEISLTISIKRPEGCNGSAGRETSYINNDILAVGRQCKCREGCWVAAVAIDGKHADGIVACVRNEKAGSIQVHNDAAVAVIVRTSAYCEHD